MSEGNWRDCTDFFYSISVNEDICRWVKVSEEDAEYLLEHPDIFSAKVDKNVAYITGKRVRTRHDGDCTFYAAMENCQITDGICTCGYAHYWKPSIGAEQWYKMMYSEQRLQIMEADYQKRVKESGLTEPEYRHKFRQDMAKRFGPPVCAFCGSKMVDTWEAGNPDGDWECFNCKQ